MKAHLLKNCPKYLSHMRQKGVDNSITLEARGLSSAQRRIKFPKLLPEEKSKLNLAFAKVCYVQSLPFNIYESKTMRDAISKLNPTYKPPDGKAIATELLDVAYNTFKERVDSIIHALPHLNIIGNENTNINHTRIFNISIHTDHGAVHWLSEDIGHEQMTSMNIATKFHHWMYESRTESSETSTAAVQTPVRQ